MRTGATFAGMVLERVKGRERLKHPLGLAIRPKKIKPGSLVPPLTLEQLAALEGMLGRSATNKQKRKEARRIYYGRMKEVAMYPFSLILNVTDDNLWAPQPHR